MGERMRARWGSVSLENDPNYSRLMRLYSYSGLANRIRTHIACLPTQQIICASRYLPNHFCFNHLPSHRPSMDPPELDLPTTPSSPVFTPCPSLINMRCLESFIYEEAKSFKLPFIDQSQVPNTYPPICYGKNWSKFERELDNPASYIHRLPKNMCCHYFRDHYLHSEVIYKLLRFTNPDADNGAINPGKLCGVAAIRNRTCYFWYIVETETDLKLSIIGVEIDSLSVTYKSGVILPSYYKSVIKAHRNPNPCLVLLVDCDETNHLWFYVKLVNNAECLWMCSDGQCFEARTFYYTKWNQIHFVHAIPPWAPSHITTISCISSAATRGGIKFKPLFSNIAGRTTSSCNWYAEHPTPRLPGGHMILTTQLGLVNFTAPWVDPEAAVSAFPGHCAADGSCFFVKVAARPGSYYIIDTRSARPALRFDFEPEARHALCLVGNDAFCALTFQQNGLPMIGKYERE